MNTVGQLFPRQPRGILAAPGGPCSVTPTKGSSWMSRKVKWKELGSCDTRHSAARLFSHNHSVSLMTARRGRVIPRPGNAATLRASRGVPPSCFLTQAPPEARTSPGPELKPGKALGTTGRASWSSGLLFCPLSSLPVPPFCPRRRRNRSWEGRPTDPRSRGGPRQHPDTLMN